jgi:hypothetical protein
MPVQHLRVLGALLVVVLGLPPLAVLAAPTGGDSVNPFDMTLLVVELVVASGLVLAWHLRQHLSRSAEPGLVPVRVRRRGRSGVA